MVNPLSKEDTEWLDEFFDSMLEEPESELEEAQEDDTDESKDSGTET